MTRRGDIPQWIRLIFGLYLVVALIALVVLVVDPAQDPLSGIFLVIAAMPWTPLAGRLLDLMTEPPVWLGVVLLLAGVGLNAGLLYLLGRWLGGRQRCQSPSSP